MSGQDEKLQVPTSLEQAHSQLELRDKFIAEAVNLIYTSGLLDNMSTEARKFLSSSPHIQKMIAEGDPPSLEPRLTLKEYINHIMNILDVPKNQHEFTAFIVKVVYVMILAEKNPLVAQELRGVLSVNTQLKEILGG